jgi:hypothetical protein
MTMPLSEEFEPQEPQPEKPQPEGPRSEEPRPEEPQPEKPQFEDLRASLLRPEGPGETPPLEPPPLPVRRRRRRSMAAGFGQRSEYMDDLFHLSGVSFDFFLFALISGVVLMLAILLDSPALYLLAALIAPFMAPVLGMSLGLASGSIGLFVRSLVSFMIGGVLIFGMGLLAGLLGPTNGGILPTQSYQHMQFTWPDAAVLALGMLITVYLAARNPLSKPLVSSVALAYELFLPLGVAGFGLIGGASMPDLWPGGMILFLVFTGLAVTIGAVMFVLQGIHPVRWFGALAGAVLFLAIAGGMVWLAASNWFGIDLLAVSDTLTPTITATLLPSETLTSVPTQTPVPTITRTLIPPTATRAATNTLLPTETATLTLGPSPTPVWGLVTAGLANGVIIRPDPNSTDVVTTLLNGNLIQILPEIVIRGGVVWIHVRTTTGLEGWVQGALIATATPRPN